MKTKALGITISVLLATAGAACGGEEANSYPPPSNGELTPDDPLPAVVLVHGGFVDGSGWEGVYRILKRDGYEVSVVQNPTVSLADDVTVRAVTQSTFRTRT